MQGLSPCQPPRAPGRGSSPLAPAASAFTLRHPLGPPFARRSAGPLGRHQGARILTLYSPCPSLDVNVRWPRPSLQGPHGPIRASLTHRGSRGSPPGPWATAPRGHVPCCTSVLSSDSRGHLLHEPRHKTEFPVLPSKRPLAWPDPAERPRTAHLPR